VDVIANAVVELFADFRYLVFDNLLEQFVASVPVVILSFQLVDLVALEERQLFWSRN